jgi:hypothetical protein
MMYMSRYNVSCVMYFWLAYDRLGRSSISYFVAYSVDVLLDVQVMPRAVLGLYKHGTEAREGNTLVHQFPHLVHMYTLRLVIRVGSPCVNCLHDSEQVM